MGVRSGKGTLLISSIDALPLRCTRSLPTITRVRCPGGFVEALFGHRRLHRNLACCLALVRIGWRPSPLGWRPLLLETRTQEASRLEAIACCLALGELWSWISPQIGTSHVAGRGRGRWCQSLVLGWGSPGGSGRSVQKEAQLSGRKDEGPHSLFRQARASDAEPSAQCYTGPALQSPPLPYNTPRIPMNRAPRRRGFFGPIPAGLGQLIAVRMDFRE